MAESPVQNGRILKEIEAARGDIAALTALLIGSPDSPDKPGLMERVRLTEKAIHNIFSGIRWASIAIGGIILADLITRILTWYRNGQ